MLGKIFRMEERMPLHKNIALALPLLTSHMIAVLSTDADAMQFPSGVQQISYTSSKWPLQRRIKESD